MPGTRLPELIPCLHNCGYALPLVSMTGTRILLPQKAEKVGLPPQTRKIPAPLLNAHRAELHAVDVNNRKMPDTVDAVKKYIPGRIVTVIYAGFVKTGSETNKRNEYILYIFYAGIAKLIEASLVWTLLTYKVGIADQTHTVLLNVGYGTRGFKPCGKYS